VCGCSLFATADFFCIQRRARLAAEIEKSSVEWLAPMRLRMRIARMFIIGMDTEFPDCGGRLSCRSSRRCALHDRWVSAAFLTALARSTALPLPQ
jgi:hypothetical protein